MFQRLALTLIVVLSLGLLLVEPASAQRGRPSGGGSRPSSTPSRPSSTPSSRPSSRPSATPSRPSSRPSPTPSRPSSTPSRPSSTPSRSISRPSSSPSRVVTPSPSSSPSRSVVTAPTPDRGSRGASAGGSTPVGASGTPLVDRGPSGTRSGEASAPTRGSSSPNSSWRPSSAGSTPVGGDATRGSDRPAVIDVTGAALPPRVRFPAAYSGSRDPGNGLSGRIRDAGQGSVRSPGDRPRSGSEGPAANRAAEQLAARRAQLSRSRDLSASDVLDRYPGSRDARANLSDRTRSDADRAAAARSNAQRAQDARGAADTAQVRPLSGRSRGDAAGTRTEPAGSGASDAERMAAMRTAQQQQSDATRMQAARSAYLASVDQRSNALGLETRGNLVNAVGGTGNPDYDNGYGDGYSDGFYDGTQYVNHCFWGTWYNNYSWCWSPCYYACTYWWNSWWWSGCWSRWGWWPRYYWYGPYVSPSYSYVETVVEREVVYVEAAPAAEVLPEGEAVARRGEPAGDPVLGMSLDRAADHFLAQGDSAFREGRYSDAVHHYAKAVEYAPDEGVLWLILSDALFATGDYHYAAYALRKALELDPELATNVVDKHEFYSDPLTFDRQLAVLERYLEDHFLDLDARLLLAANYLFGGRPAAAVDLLENPFSMEVKQSTAGALLLESARALQYGPAAPAAPSAAGR